MAMDPRKRQQKLARQKEKAKAKRKTTVDRGPRDLISRIERAAAAPLLHCCYPRAVRILGDADAASCSEQFTYGKDGKPAASDVIRHVHGRISFAHAE